jgi:hypothetical protein
MAEAEKQGRDDLADAREQFQNQLNEKDEMQKRMEVEFNELPLEQEQTHLDKIKEQQDQFSQRLDKGDGEH